MAATILLDDNSTERIVSVGDMLTYKAHVHASVGFACSCEILGVGVLNLLEEDTEFDDPESIAAGMCGGDSANKIFAMEAIAAGEAFVMFEHIFRGKVERTVRIRIEVV